MKTLYFNANTEQKNALIGLAYRIADNAYMVERYGTEETKMERADNHKTIMLLFDQLDALRVPFWVQNSVICAAENWREYKSGAIISRLEKRNIHGVHF